MLVEDGVFEALSISGDSRLGGQDFDQRVTDHFVEVIKQKHGRDITGNGRALQRLRRECERAKRALGDQPEARVEVEALLDGVDLSEPLTRAQLEELNEDLFMKAMAQVEKAVSDAELDKREIDEIILVGGSTRIPKVQQLVRDCFDGKEPLSGIDPDEAMAYGAAVQGSYLTRYDHEEPQMDRYSPWYDVLSIGIETEDGKMTRVIPRNPTLPTKKTHVLTTFWDKRSTVTIKVFEGERSETKDCRFLGQLELSGIPAASIWNWGRRDIEVTLEADEYGELRVEAADKRSGKWESAIIDRSGRLSPEEIDRMAREWEALQARDELEAYLRSVMDAVDGKMEPEEEEAVEAAVTKARGWFDVNPVAGKEDYEEHLRELVDVCYPVVSAVHQRFPGGHDDDEL
ncbi:hypothetical protein ACQ4PT_006474 [Festuca glaucescens]